MSSSEIVREIERETDAEVERLLAAAEEQAAVILEHAAAALHAHVEAAVARAEPALRAEAARRVNEARLRLNERLVQLALARTAAVHAAAAERLEAIAEGVDGGRWAYALARLTREALGLAGPGATVRVRAGDASLIAEQVARLAGRLEPLGTGAPAGLAAISADGRVEVDATIPVRLERARTRLAEVVAAHLGIDG